MQSKKQNKKGPNYMKGKGPIKDKQYSTTLLEKAVPKSFIQRSKKQAKGNSHS